MKYWLLCAALLRSAPAHAQSGATEPPPQRARLALSTTSAIGVTHGRFFNQLVGARFDYRFTTRFAFGGVLSYANLKGKDGRAHNVLPEAALEYRLPLAFDRFGLPLRFSAGHLPKNGPTLRLSAGLSWALSERLWLDVVPLEPMVWVTRERPEVSLDASLALGASF